MKSLLIPAALALSLVATESSALEVKKFERAHESTSKAFATRVCDEFKGRRGTHYQIMKEWVANWKRTNHPHTVYHREAIGGYVQQKTTDLWRCNMAWKILYSTYPR